jgi:hypothetical protein
MSNVVGLTDAAAHALLDTLRARMDAGSGPAIVEFYTGSRPASSNLAATGTLLGTLTFSDPAAPAAASRLLTFSTITEDASADASGTATWARIKDSTGATVFDCDVSAAGGGGLIILNTTSIVAGGPIRITSFTLAM